MITVFPLIILGMLILIAILDWKTKSVPSVITTALIFSALFINQNVLFGLLAFVFGYLLYEFDFFSGVADIKAVTIIGLMVSSVPFFFGFCGITVVIGLFWKIVYKQNNPKAKEVPFIPAILFTYIILLLSGGIA